MAHLSQKKMEPGIQKLLEEELLSFLTRHKTGMRLAQELLTETELLMLAKRLAAIFMLENEFSYYRISKTLSLSPSTVRRLHKGLVTDAYPAAEEIVHERREQKEFQKRLGKILRLGLPPYRYERSQDIDMILGNSGRKSDSHLRK